MPDGTAEHDASELFDRFTERLVSSVSTRDEVLGLVLLGSGAQRERLDEWSDHDFYLVVRDEVAEQMRRDLSWLPDPERIVLAPRETAHGLKVVYDDAHVLELAVATLDEVAGFATNHHRVVLDRGGVADAIHRAVEQTPGPREVDVDRALGLFLTLLLIGAGRARRGELVAAGAHVRTYAVAELIDAWTTVLPPSGDAFVDHLDRKRRFEDAYPGVGARLDAALAQSPEDAARTLLDLAEEHLAGHVATWPAAGVKALRTRFGWPTPPKA